MKKALFLLFCFINITLLHSQNRWNIYVGGSMNHIVKETFSEKGKTRFDWGGGAFIGSGFELNFNNHWSFSPSLELSYNDNGAYYSDTGKPAFNHYGYEGSENWTGSWGVSIPLTVGFRFPVSGYLKFKIDAGVYISESFYVSHYYPKTIGSNNNLEKRKATNDFGNFLQTGFIGSVAVETGNNLSYFFRTQYPFLKSRFSSNVLTLSIGAKYSF